MNTAAIANAIAARFAGVTASNGTVTERIITGPTARLPAQVGQTPALLVFLPTGDLGVTARRRTDVLTFPVRLLRDPLDVPTRVDWLYAWYDALRDVVEGKMTLGLAYVAWAQPTAVTVELDGFTYAGTDFDLVELTVAVRLDEVISTLAP